jgi:hypothetical protein
VLYQLSYWPLPSYAGRDERREKREEKPESSIARFSSLSPLPSPLTANLYFVSLCPVCFRQYRQYLLNSRRSDDFFRFFVVL